MFSVKALPVALTIQQRMIERQMNRNYAGCARNRSSYNLKKYSDTPAETEENDEIVL
jgi:hypothetical protein